MKTRYLYNPATKMWRSQWKGLFFWHTNGHWEHYYSGSDFIPYEFDTKEKAILNAADCYVERAKDRNFKRNNHWIEQ